ncbi:MAG: enoyl-CoA hydratase/isomerase family protein [Lautropia sp.]
MKATFQKILVEQDGKVLYLTLNNPAKLNPMNLDVMAEIDRCLDEAREDDGIRVVVVRGAGRAFCAGEDVTQGHHWFLEGKAGTFLQGWREKMQKMRLFPKVLIFQIHGWCVGGAVEMALCADFLIAAEDAKLMLPQVNIGITAMLEGAIIPQAVGIVRAKQIVLTGQPIDGKEAARIGLVSEAVPPDALVARVEELANEMAEKFPAVIAAQKEIIHHWMTTDLESSIEHSVLVICKLMGNPQVFGRMKAIADRYDAARSK